MISIIIRTYNNERFIRKAVQTAVKQSFNDYEIIVVNDGSTDKTKKILEEYSKNIPKSDRKDNENSKNSSNKYKNDPSEKENNILNRKLMIIHQENKGPIEAGYQGLKASKGDLVIFLDGDDEFKPTILSDLYQALLEQPKAAFAYGDYEEIDLRDNNNNNNNSSNKIVSCENIFNTLACGILFKKETITEIGFWDKKFKFPEYDLLLRILKKYKGVHVKKPLYVYNRHPQAFTADQNYIREGRKELEEKYGPIEQFKEY